MRGKSMRTIRRATTPTLHLFMPFEAAKVADGYVTFTQRDVIVIDKRIRDKSVRVEDRRIVVKLSQSETMRFSAGSRGEIQLRLLLTDNNAPASNIEEFFVGRVLKEGILSASDGFEGEAGFDDVLEFNMDFDVVTEMGFSDHSKLENRDAADQHPISAITGLQKALSDKMAADAVADDEEIAEMLNDVFGKKETKMHLI